MAESWATPVPIINDHLTPGLDQAQKDFISSLSVIGAIEDVELAHAFLRDYRPAQHAFRTYRREVERLLYWLWIVRQQRAVGAPQTALEDYQSFLSAVPADWVMTVRQARFTPDGAPNPQWRPFFSPGELSGPTHAVSDSVESVAIDVSRLFLRFADTGLDRLERHFAAYDTSSDQKHYQTLIKQIIDQGYNEDNFREVRQLLILRLIEQGIDPAGQAHALVYGNDLQITPSGVAMAAIRAGGGRVKECLFPAQTVELFMRCRELKHLPREPAEGEVVYLVMKQHGTDGVRSGTIRDILRQLEGSDQFEDDTVLPSAAGDGITL